MPTIKSPLQSIDDDYKSKPLNLKNKKEMMNLGTRSQYKMSARNKANSISIKQNSLVKSNSNKTI